MNISRIALIPLLACAMAGCAHPSLHLTSADKDQKADITVNGHEGYATWEWGPHQYAQNFQVVEDSLITLGPEAGGVLKLKMASGAQITLAIEQNAVVCGDTQCNDLHMPSIWWVEPN
jgi:hypothetical protein